MCTSCLFATAAREKDIINRSTLVWRPPYPRPMRCDAMNTSSAKRCRTEKNQSGNKNGLKSFREKLTTNCRFLEFEELVPDEPNDEAGFADGRVAQQDQLEVAYPVSAHDSASFYRFCCGVLVAVLMFSKFS